MFLIYIDIVMNFEVLRAGLKYFFVRKTIYWLYFVAGMVRGYLRQPSQVGLLLVVVVVCVCVNTLGCFLRSLRSLLRSIQCLQSSEPAKVAFLRVVHPVQIGMYYNWRMMYYHEYVLSKCNMIPKWGLRYLKLILVQLNR